jgi:DNA-binding protein H-NS
VSSTDQYVGHRTRQNTAPHRVLHVLNFYFVEALLYSTEIQITTVHRPLWEIRTRVVLSHDFAPMSIEELSKLHETVEAVLAKKIAAEIIALERYLQRLSPAADIVQRGSQKPSKAADTGRRPYPPVLPKYRSPTRPSETWAGRGKQPHAA